MLHLGGQAHSLMACPSHRTLPGRDQDPTDEFQSQADMPLASVWTNRHWVRPRHNGTEIVERIASLPSVAGTAILCGHLWAVPDGPLRGWARRLRYRLLKANSGTPFRSIAGGVLL